jgi:Zn finger protein HypA/HybF involved in hydrogenase expression
VKLHEELAALTPALRRGQVWCRECGGTQKVNTARALAYGWPKCCGYTMTIDSPEEQRALSANSETDDPKQKRRPPEDQ